MFPAHLYNVNLNLGEVKMAFIKNLADLPEMILMPDGEYNLRIIRSMKSKPAKTGRNGLMLVHNFIDEDNAIDLIETMWFGNDDPSEEGAYTGDDDSKSDLMWRMFQDRLKAWDMNSDGDLEPEDFVGIEFSAYVVIEDDGEYPAKNVIKKIT